MWDTPITVAAPFLRWASKLFESGETSAQKMAQCLRTGTLLAEDQIVEPSTHASWLTTASNSSYRGMPWPLRASLTSECINQAELKQAITYTFIFLRC